jgi:hypothetical protein
MSGSLILLPLRLGTRAVELGLRGATEVLERVAGLAGVKSSQSGAAPASEPDTSPAPAPTSVTPPPRPVQTQQAGDAEPLIDRGERVDYDAPEVVEPAHIDTRDELVEEVAEPGAEDGAGAQVRIAEPWEGYRDLRAAEIVERIRTASPEELAAVELFELAGRGRQTVISAAQSELRRR